MRKETVSHVDDSGNEPHKFVRSYEYDKWGNITKEKEPSGICTVNEYYPAEGAQGSCPAHPLNMVAYVSKRTHHAADNSASKVHEFTYKSVGRIGGGNTIVPATKKFANTTKTFQYFDNSLPKLQGAPKSETVTVNGKSTTKACSYKFDVDTVCVTDTTTGHDNTSLSTSKTLCLFTGLTKKEMDENGIETVYVHDQLDRKVSETAAAGTDYSFKTTYSYVSKPSDPVTGEPCIGTSVTQTTTSGTTVHTLYDGEHRELTIHQKDDHGTLRKVSENKYDNQGRKVYRSQLDYIISDDGTVEKNMSEEATYVYDCWGEKSETHHNNGTVEITKNDPVTLKTIEQVVYKDAAGNVTDSLSKSETTQDLFGNPISRRVFTKEEKVYSTMSFSYDGFGRKAKVTTPSGNIAKILKYDDFDRPLEFQHYDGTTFKVTYADHTIEAIVDSISVPTLSTTIGQQKYDGLSRITSRTVSGVKTQFSYEGGFDRPSRRINGRGQTTLIKYIPELEMQIARVASFKVPIGAWDNSSKNSDAVFTYSKKADASRGRILSAVSSTTRQHYDYTSHGKVKSATQTVGNVSQTTTNQKLSMEGKRVMVKMGDRTTHFEYDSHGHLVSTTENDIKTEMQLDNFGRVSKKLVKQHNPQTKSYDLVQTTETNYDEHSREIRRVISFAGNGKTISIDSAYDSEDKIVQRTTLFSELGSLTETFKYDGKRRLQMYQCSKHTSDSLLPRNENGRPFLSQSFCFDGLDNITSTKTSFPGGGVDTAKYSYNATHKQVLHEISHTLTTGENAYPPQLKFEYDADGNLVSSGDTKMSYTTSNRLSKMNDTVYVYDSLDRLVQSNKTVHLYSGHHVVHEVEGDTTTTDIIRCGDIPIAEIQNKGQKKFYGVDQKLSVVCVTDKNTTFNNYSPFGSGKNGVRIGFNGEMRDTVDGNVYHLGNGTRCYLPAICAFSSNDSYAPFQGGGINPYAYCGSDPMNAINPSGHVSWQAILGAFVAVAALIAVPFTGGSSLALFVGAVAGVAGVVSSGLEIGAEVAAEQGNEKLSKELGFYSMTFGVASTVLSVGQIAANVAKVAKAGMAAKPAMKSASRLISADSDDLVTTGYKTRFAIARQKNTLPGNAKKFAVIKAPKKGTVKGSFKLPSVKNLISEKKFGPLYLRKVREPIRIMKGGRYAGMSNILSKNSAFSELFSSAGLMGAPLMNVVSYFSKLEDHMNEASGSEPELNRQILTAHGLPVASGQSFGAERMLFYYI